MSCLTKKSLFFLVLSIVCNVTLSDRKATCRANLRLVFFEAMDPYCFYLLGMFGFSEKAIADFTNTAELSSSILQQFERFRDELDESETRYLGIMGTYIANNNVTFTDEMKRDISGYFKSLLWNFNTLSDPIQTTMRPPQMYCDVKYPIDREACRDALKTFFQKNDEELNEMDAYDAFKHCYTHYRHLDFYDDRLFTILGINRDSLTYTDWILQNYHNKIMKAYYTYLKLALMIIIEVTLGTTDPDLFMTIRGYCAYN